jgi:NADH-quinone oxidoreductase subunit C
MQTFLDRLKAQFPEAVTRTYASPRGDDYAVVLPTAIREVAAFCKADPELDLKICLSVCAVDRLLLTENEPRFEIIYQLRQGRPPWKKVHLKTHVGEDSPSLPSVQPVWKGADWWERYCYDFYGIRFEGHPDLRRILLYEEFKGHPLRKDYPTKARQPLVAERNFRDIIRGPGATPPPNGTTDLEPRTAMLDAKGN